MQLTGNLIQLLPLQTGNGKNGEWKKQDIIIETQAQYPKKVCIAIWGDKINAALLKPGAAITISFDVESREYNGRWYTDVKAWKIEPAGSAESGANQQQPFADAAPADDYNDFNNTEDDLPF